MELLTGVLSAVIAASISLIVAFISFVANKNELKAEREKLERELQRNMTIKLYEARIEVYPEAIAITDGLRKSRMTSQGDGLSQQYFNEILAKLDAWHSEKAFLLLSWDAVQTLYRLRKVLRAKPDMSGSYSKEQLMQIWRAKGAFRSALRSDIQLLYNEESDEENADDLRDD